jgi:hypothetical protein
MFEEEVIVSKYHAFVSHSSLDIEIVEEVLDSLEDNGVRCWIAPRDIAIGTSFAKAIVEGIKISKVFIVIFTKNSNLSEQVLREIDRAVHQKKKIFVFKIDDTSMQEAVEYYLCKGQWIDATYGEVSQYYEQLVAEVKVYLVKQGILNDSKYESLLGGERKDLKKARLNRLNLKINKKKRKKYRAKKVYYSLLLSIFFIMFGIFLIHKQQNRKSGPPKKNTLYTKRVESDSIREDYHIKAQEGVLEEYHFANKDKAGLEEMLQKIKTKSGQIFEKTRGGVKKKELNDMELMNIQFIKGKLNRLLFHKVLANPKHMKSFIYLDVDYPEIEEGDLGYLNWKLNENFENMLRKKYFIPALRNKLYMRQKLGKVERNNNLKNYPYRFIIRLIYKNTLKNQFSISIFSNKEHVQQRKRLEKLHEYLSNALTNLEFEAFEDNDFVNRENYITEIVIVFGHGRSLKDLNPNLNEYPDFVESVPARLSHAMFEFIIKELH